MQGHCKMLVDGMHVLHFASTAAVRPKPAAPIRAGKPAVGAEHGQNEAGRVRNAGMSGRGGAKTGEQNEWRLTSVLN